MRLTRTLVGPVIGQIARYNPPNVSLYITAAPPFEHVSLTQPNAILANIIRSFYFTHQSFLGRLPVVSLQSAEPMSSVGRSCEPDCVQWQPSAGWSTH